MLKVRRRARKERKKIAQRIPSPALSGNDKLLPIDLHSKQSIAVQLGFKEEKRKKIVIALQYKTSIKIQNTFCFMKEEKKKRKEKNLK